MLGDDVSNLFAVPENPAIATLPGSQGFWLMIFYNAGVIGIFGLYMLLKLHALSKRKQLELDEVELILTRGAISIDAVMVCVGIVSILLAFVSPPLSGLIYFVLPSCFCYSPLSGHHGMVQICSSSAGEDTTEGEGASEEGGGHETAAE